MAVNYVASRRAAVPVEPLDIDAALDYGLEYSSWLQTNETLQELDVTAADPDGLVALGDGVTVFASKAGNVTPDAPAISGTQVTAWVYATQASAADNVGKHVTLDFTVRTSGGRVDSRSLLIQLAER